MDPVSHAVLGRLVTMAAGPAESRRGVAAVSVLGALSPDVDFVLMPVGWDVYLRFHGIGTHSLLGAVATGLGSALLVKAFARSTRYRVLATASVLGAFSHLGADLVSGGRLHPGWPIWSGVPFAPLVAMADPWTIAILTCGAAAVWRSRQRRPRAARLVLAVLALFLSLKGVLLATALTRSTFDGDAAPASRLVEAEWGSLTRWHVFSRAARELRDVRIAATEPEAVPVLTIDVPGESPLIEASRSLSTVRNFHRVHDLTFPIVQPAQDGEVFVLWSDIRYCRARQGAIGIDCGLWFGGLFTAEGRVMREQVRVGAWWRDRMPRAPSGN